MKKALYITIEGGDGSGKSTLVKDLHQYLLKNYKVLLTAEFGGEHDKLCNDLRDITLSSKKGIDETAGQIVFGAICKQHQEKVIKPNLNKFEIILSDRGPHSNYAYGIAHDLSPKFINGFFDLVYMDAAKPDITIFLNTPVEIAFERSRKRAPEKFKDGGTDRVEDKGLAFQKKVNENFLNLARKDKKIKVISVEANMTPADILTKTLKVLKLD
jgi:dTMP kinase